MGSSDAQQAGEKALKAFLAAHNVAFRSTHNLEELLSQTEAIEASFGQFSVAARTLTPYAVRFRYPGGPLAPTSLEAEEALHLADHVVRFVRLRLGL